MCAALDAAPSLWSMPCRASRLTSQGAYAKDIHLYTAGRRERGQAVAAQARGCALEPRLSLPVQSRSQPSSASHPTPRRAGDVTLTLTAAFHRSARPQPARQHRHAHKRPRQRGLRSAASHITVTRPRPLRGTHGRRDAIAASPHTRRTPPRAPEIRAAARASSHRSGDNGDGGDGGVECAR